MRRRGTRNFYRGFAGEARHRSPLAIDHADAQQGAVSQNANSSAATENNGQDFTRPQNLLQLRYIYQTAPGSGVNGYDPHGDDRSGGASVGLEDRCRPAMDTRLARRSAACGKKPDYSRQSDGRFRRRSWRHRPSSSAHQDRERALGDRRGHPHYRSDRRARPHQQQMASAADQSAFVTCCRN